MRRLATPLVLVAAITAGCGEDVPRFDRATACAVDTQRIVDVLGTDRFTISNGFGALPMGQDRTDTYLCEVATDGARPVLSIRVEYDDDLGISDVSDSIERLEEFPVVDGRGRAAVDPPGDPDSTDVSSVWTCGNVTGSLRTSVDDVDVEAVRVLTEDLADAAGCYVYEPSAATG